ncbi:MAG: hypothetical protein IPK60_18955 [Sandaracinaceae bacterium]|nr:hypothetical protein [Sandaracinaceae bacterium]
MRTRTTLIPLLVLALSGCATLANTGEGRRSTQTDAERATPSTRTSDDELDGPTAPRGSAYRGLDQEDEAEGDMPYEDEDN